jgi:ATP-dependent helicase/nuclease subunit B
MLTLLLGRAGSGTSTSVFNRIKKNGQNRPQILLVPEQSSYEIERRLCEENGNGVSLYAEVFSFTSLAKRLVSLSGGAAVPILDDGGRVLVMYAALKALSGNLSVLSIPSQKPEFITRLISTIDELKSYCVSSEALSEIAEEMTGLTAKKLHDLALIYGTYDAIIGKGMTDPRDQLTRLYENLKKVPFAQGKDCFIDGFTDFTPQEELVIDILLRQSDSLTVALTCDQLQDDDTSIFSVSRHTGNLLLKIAKKNHIPVRIETINMCNGEKKQALSYLEQNLFLESFIPYTQDSQDVISVTSLATRREEVTWVAGKIRELLQTGDVRCRDVAVTARNMEPYRDLVESIFSRYEIPVFQSSMQPILQKPIFTLVTSALNVLTGNYAYEDVFCYLKTGLTNVSREECDELENYVLLWNIRGTQWTSPEGFFRHPNGYQKQFEPEDQKLLEKLNEIRCKVISPFETFREKHRNSIRSKVFSLYEFLENISLPEQLELRASEFLARGEPELALEYRQIWDVFCNALEQSVDLLGDLSVDLEEFSKLLKILFAQYTVGSIPASLDRVIAGDLPRLSNRHIKTLFLLGAEDSAIPQVTPGQGLFSEHDRELLSEYGIQLASGIEMQMNKEMTIIYTGCAQPSTHLFVTWPTLGDAGEKKQPSFLIEKLMALFPQPSVEHEKEKVVSNHPTALQLLALDYPELYERIQQSAQFSIFLNRLEGASSWKRGRLSRQSIEQLYGETISISPSRLDQYQSCRFAYYMRYGLKAKPRKVAGFHAPEYGVFVHYVLEYVLREGKKSGGVNQISDDQIEEFIKKAVQRYIRDILGGLEKQTPRFRYLFFRLQRTVSLVIQNVVEELRNSDFQPIYFELGFGHGKELPPVELTEEGITLSISGFVDRVDGWVKDGRLYLKVVDYKTGRKSFDFTDVWNGLGLQMLLYLFALENNGDVLGDYEIIPAGVLYLPARDAVISGSRGMEEATRQRLIDKELTRKGLILDDPAVIEAMEFPTEGGPRFLPVRVSAKTGKVSGDALVSAERLGRLKKHIQKILKDICIELNNGQITADPYWRSPTQNACLYCEYSSACHFEEELGEDHRRWMPTIKNSDFWSHLEAQEMGGNTDEV